MRGTNLHFNNILTQSIECSVCAAGLPSVLFCFSPRGRPGSAATLHCTANTSQHHYCTTAQWQNRFAKVLQTCLLFGYRLRCELNSRLTDPLPAPRSFLLPAPRSTRCCWLVRGSSRHYNTKAAVRAAGPRHCHSLSTVNQSLKTFRATASPIRWNNFVVLSDIGTTQHPPPNLQPGALPPSGFDIYGEILP